MNKTKLLSSTILATFLSTHFVMAQALETDEDGDTTILSDVIISAGRTPIEEGKTGRAYTVIDKEEIERFQSRNVADVLRQVPGISVSPTNGVGGITQVRVRGAEANHVLVLIDGVEVSELSTDEFDFAGLEVTDIERIEVLRGAQSAFYGSDALAGVINIITNGGNKNTFQTGFETEYGSDNSRQISGYVRGGTDNFTGNLFISRFLTDGYNISNFGSEDDGADRFNLNGKFSWDLTSELSLNGSIRYVERNADTDGQPFGSRVLDTNENNEVEETSGSIGFNHDTSDGAWSQLGRYSYSETERKNYKNGNIDSGTEGNREKFLYQITHRFADASDNNHLITGGYEWERETFNALPPVFDASQLDEHTRQTSSFVGEYRGEFQDTFFLNAAIRHDDNDSFQDKTTYSIAAAWVNSDTGSRIHASVGTGFKAPTFYELYGFIPTSFKGNPDLSPEESFSWDIGIEQEFFNGALVVDITYFNQDLENEIDTNFNVFPFEPINLEGTSEREGIEVGVKGYFGDGFIISGQYTYIDSRDPENKWEVRRPRNSGSVKLDYVPEDKNYSLYAEAVFNGDMADNDFSTSPSTPVILGSYAVVGIGGTYNLNDKIQLFARVENLFDEDYENVYDYSTPGREGFIGLRGKF